MGIVTLSFFKTHLGTDDLLDVDASVASAARRTNCFSTISMRPKNGPMIHPRTWTRPGLLTRLNDEYFTAVPPSPLS